MVTINTARVTGFTPMLDRKQLSNVSVVGGKNVRPTVTGHKTAFCLTPVTKCKLPTAMAKGAAMFRLTGTSTEHTASVVCNQFGILVYDEASTDWAYITPPLAVPLELTNRWSYAYVGGEHFFCHKNYGVAVWNRTTGSFFKLTEALVTSPMSICEAQGRLIILGQDSYQWSAIGDGKNLTPSLTTGAGFQALTLVGNGDPLGVVQTITGFSVYTSNGMITAQSIQSALVWYHSVISGKEFAPLSQRAIVATGGGRHIIITKTGMYASDGTYPEQFEPVVGKYLVDEIIRPKQRGSGYVELYYSTTEDSLYILTSATATAGSLYTGGLVFDFTIGEWGIMTRPCYCIGDFGTNEGLYSGTWLAVVNTRGELCYIGDTTNNWKTVDDYQLESLIAPVIPTVTYIDDVVNFSLGITCKAWQFGNYPRPAQWTFTKAYIIENEPTELIVPSEMFIQDIIDMELLPDAVVDMELGDDVVIDMEYLPDGFPQWNEGLSAKVYLNEYYLTEVGLKKIPMDSQVTVGLISLPREDNDNRTTVVTSVSQAHENYRDEGLAIDMELSPDIIIDMELEDDGVIDMGLDASTTVQFTSTITPSTDGYTSNGLGEMELVKSYTSGNRTTFNAYATGMYHLINVYATAEDDFFHLKNLDSTTIYGGIQNE